MKTLLMLSFILIAVYASAQKKAISDNSPSALQTIQKANFKTGTNTVMDVGTGYKLKGQSNQGKKAGLFYHR